MSQKCSICGSDSQKILDFGGYQYQGQFYNLVKCLECGFMFLSPKPSRELLEGSYNNPEYFAKDYGGGAEVAYQESFEINKQRYEDIVKRIKRYKKKGNLLEVGCAGGHFLKFAESAGYQVKGVEISNTMAKLAREEFNLDVLAGTIEGLGLPSQSFDIIYLGDLLEHVYNLKLFLEEIFRILKPSGLIYIDIPGTYNYTLLGIILYLLVALKSILKGESPFSKKCFLLKQHRDKHRQSCPYHLYEFTPKSIKELLVRHNFLPVKVISFDGPPKRKGCRTIKSKLFYWLKKISHATTYVLNFIKIGDRITALAVKKNI